MPKSELPSDPTRAAQIREHYAIERELADRLRNSDKEHRAGLYTAVYDELFRKVPFHPQIVAAESREERIESVRKSLKLLGDELDSQATFLEIGPGDCALSIEAAKRVKYVYAVDVSPEISMGRDLPENISVVISDGSSIDLPDNSVDIAYSNQLMEHLHPEDAVDQLRNIYRVLKPGGRYWCITPNRLTGPHDVSEYFDDEATGFHLKEYTNAELVDLFHDAGFSSVKSGIGKQGYYARFPVGLKLRLERSLDGMTTARRQKLCKNLLVRLILRIIIVGTK